ncbi:bifunctional homocysteine S-methyltransferase/methylenetetrahydrofolate reductase [Virgibacillus sp.]|uniref:bifunctional homocysteine S-methyltransferase/methylenetetrahydrofolate reductase n=1 Tax=Virgibacillus sp. TaxID=1872700 RepID=UPI0017FCEE23|nr:bifunctional homocysteine S-methyltransferase/methylenetetrahydrofolate reductase [Virgibacillus sp.]NWO12402.1 bifunctional homocysteine S-methyltransferase/methylenetetrahydrofolate reductase [Virgibacillus sp.]
MSLLQQLQNQILIADGAMGTMLYSYGIDQSFEQLNITHPNQVQQVHEAYIHAGATVIQTNTYGANYIKLARYGLEDQVKRINQKAVQIAKEARQKGVSIVGGIGGIHGVQALNETKEEIKRSFREQLYCLLLEGVDGLILETYYNLDELKMVLEIAREETKIPIIANVSMHVPGILENGTPLAEALQQLEALGADLVGVNCRFGPSQIITSLQSVPIPKRAFLAAYPNASLPAYRDGVLYYENEPDYFRECASQLREQGVRLVGGCCGTTPNHIKALAEGLNATNPITEKVVDFPKQDRVMLKRKRKEKSLAELAKERHTIIVELDAPKHLDMTEYQQGIQALKEAGIDAVTLADNSLATPRICNTAIATIIKEQGIKPLVHIACRDRNLIGLQSHLMGLHILGIHEILAITGDPTKIGSFPGATSVFDVNSFKLIERIKKGNQGMSFSGHSLREHTAFTVGAAFSPNVNNVEKAIARLERKIASGADYIMTQPMYSKDKIIALKQATSHIDTPIFIGIMPLTSTKNAEFLHHEVPGIKLTDEARSRMKAAEGNRAQSTKESIAISKELLDTALEHFYGIYLITPFMRYDMIVELVNYIHQKTNSMRVKASLSSH